VSYASGTAVPVERSKAEIERALARYGCSEFGTGWAKHNGMDFAHVTFKHGNTSIMLGLPMPPAADFMYDARGRERGQATAEEFYAAEKRRRWRALLLVIKAKLEAVSSGISTLEREFLSDVVLPNGQTLGAWAVPMLGEIQSGRLALPAHTEAT
jgi:hypothetical protein